MAKRAIAPNTATLEEQLGEGLTPEEQAAQEAEAKGLQTNDDLREEHAEPEAEGAEAPKKKAPESIPYPRFQEVNERAKKVEQELAEERRANAEVRERWARIEERQKMAREAQENAERARQAAENAAKRPDPDLDPQGALLWDTRQQLEQERAARIQFQQQVQTGQQQINQQLNQNATEAYLNTEISRAQQKHADYFDAYNHLETTRIGHHMALGWNEADARQLWNLEAAGHIEAARRAGRSITDFVYQTAQQLGYQPKNGNGAVRQAGAPQVLPSGGQRLAQIEAGQKVQGLGRVQSAESKAQQDWQTMDEAQFATYIAQMDETKFVEMSDTRTPAGKAFNKRVLDLG
jgi:hypothetical protein